MIRWGRWSRKSDGEPMARINVSHYLTRDDLACMLIAAVVPATDDDLRDLSRAEVEKHIRAQLKDNPSRAYYWGDDYSADYSREVTEQQVLAWAKRQVAKL